MKVDARIHSHLPCPIEDSWHFRALTIHSVPEIHRTFLHRLTALLTIGVGYYGVHFVYQKWFVQISAACNCAIILARLFMDDILKHSADIIFITLWYTAGGSFYPAFFRMNDKLKMCVVSQYRLSWEWLNVLSCPPVYKSFFSCSFILSLEGFL